MNTDVEMTGDQEYRLPCAEALLAGTLALMTGHAQACCEDRRRLMGARIVSQLDQLAQHGRLSPVFRAALANLRTHWEVLQQRDAAPAAWQHPGPATLQ